MTIERGKEIEEHIYPLENIIYWILQGLIEKRYNHHYAHIIIMKQIEYCRKRDLEYEKKKKETAYQANLEWNRLIPE